MKILLCLLSEQHVPNLLSVHHFQPDRLVLIESDWMRERHQAADRFLAALAAGGKPMERDVTAFVEPLAQQDTMRDVQAAIKAAFGRFPVDEWIVNVTGGTKPMSIATHEFFRTLGATLIYVDNARPDVMNWMDGSRQETCVYRPTIKEWLLGYGFQIRKSDADISAAENRARLWWDCARAIALHAGPQELIAWADGDNGDKERGRARKKGMEMSPERMGELLKVPAITASVAQLFGLQVTNEGLVGRLDEYAARFLSGEWLEAFLWGLLDRHQTQLDLWDVRLGIEVAGRDGEPNEFDVTFMRRHNLNMLECKSGAQTHDPKTEILYKVEAVMQQFKAIRVTKYLATTSADVFAKDSTELKPTLKRRANFYQCSLLTFPMIQRLAAEADAAETVGEILEFK